jgi:hypothetical protein
MSRPQIPIDWDEVDYMLEYGALGTTIAAKFAMHPNTFYDRVEEKYKMSFTEYSQLKRSVGDDTIKEAQYRKAVKKLDNTMLVWLGKQRLGQKDNLQEQLIADEIKKPFELLMTQIKTLQDARSIDDMSLSIAANSACVTEESCPAGGNDSVISTT